MTIHTEPPKDRFCDLVMKGGITSGVVYPKAITRLSHHYHFKNIGGTSAGAIAATVTAAAEYNRRKNNSRMGFDILEELPDELQAKLPNTGRSKLLSLFQPQQATRRLFSVLIKSLNCKGAYQRILTILGGFLVAYWEATIGSIVLAFVVGYFGSSWLAAVLLLFVMLIITIGVSVYLDVTRNLVQNGFGLCNGMSKKDAMNEALTPWLHSLIQRAAGLKSDESPLTFGMLWTAPGYFDDMANRPGSSVRSIDLQMFSTNLTHGRPYIFPFAVPSAQPSRFRDRERLFFNLDELKPYLPDNVLGWMKDHHKPYQIEEGQEREVPTVEEAATKQLLELPDPENLPVILAARMSLSFPILFSAVPLWAINYDAPPSKRHFHRCWFSDGGISSNFPIHLFDGLVPRWPTFGINLEPKAKAEKYVLLPQHYEEGYGERWDLFDDKDTGVARFGGFLASIIATMQNWNDNSLARMPGVRDRIARVRLNEAEGGLNLDMEPETIHNISKRGEEAVEELILRYVAQPPDGPQPEGWDEQRFIRLCVLLKMLEARSPGILKALDPKCPYTSDFDSLIAKFTTTGQDIDSKKIPPGFEGPLTEEQAKALKNAISAVKQLMETLGNQDAQTVFRAIPEAQLRVRPPL
jgi:predicted acylesterase/phospholipase RssA